VKATITPDLLLTDPFTEIEVPLRKPSKPWSISCARPQSRVIGLLAVNILLERAYGKPKEHVEIEQQEKRSPSAIKRSTRSNAN
jgi:hypothetical protein